MANVRIETSKKGFAAVMKDTLPALEAQGQKVLAKAQATAGQAEQGSPRLKGYAAAGFSMKVDNRGDRPRVIIESNAPMPLFVRVLVSTAKNMGNGGHLRWAIQSTLGKTKEAK